MAKTRKSAKRAAKKSGGTRKKASSRRPASKAKKSATSRRKSSSTLSKRAAEGLRVARGALESLRSTTSQVVDRVKDRLGDDSERSTPTQR